MIDLHALKASYEKMWATCEVTASRLHEVTEVAQRLLGAKTTYLTVENLTTVPWWAVAVIHEREASGRWDANIANGQPWDRVTTMAPRGRGPFRSWRDAAVDALDDTPVGTLRRVSDWKDWSAAGSLIVLEMYNGFGYELYHHENSPYIWAATNHEERGKYVGDKQFDPSVWDLQLGCAAMLKRMVELDNIQFSVGKTPPLPAPIVPPPVPQVHVGHYEWQASRLVWVVPAANSGSP